MKASFVNYTSYSRGLNGLMIDVYNLPGTPTVNDFLFRMGNTLTPVWRRSERSERRLAVGSGSHFDHRAPSAGPAGRIG